MIKLLTKLKYRFRSVSFKEYIAKCINNSQIELDLLCVKEMNRQKNGGF